jgi:hypothetical protein
MKLRISLVWAAVATGTGLIVLAGFFFEIPALETGRQILVDWAVLLAAMALLIGLLNLLSVHWSKVSQQEAGWPYSAVLLLFFLVTLGLGLLFGPDSPVILFLFNNVQLPVEASLMALLAVSLTVAGFRMVRRRRDVASLLFVGVGFLVLLGTGPWLVGSEGSANTLFRDIRNWLAQIWAAGGARGILLGVALGATATGLRVLLAADRPYGE